MVFVGILVVIMVYDQAKGKQTMRKLLLEFSIFSPETGRKEHN